MTSVWTQTAELPRFPALKGDLKTEVLIIGGGAAGLLCAYFLEQEGVDYALVEADRICGGITKNTTAKVTAQHGDKYRQLLASLGAETAGQYAAAQRQAVEDYEALIRRAGIRCGWERRSSWLTAGEEAAIRFCAERYEHFLLVINGGSALDMSGICSIPGVNAILYLCQLGQEGGHAFADVLSGAVSPSGKLTDTWARRYADLPFSQEYSYLNGDLQNEFYKEGIYVGYRFFDSFGVEPAYPFGFGLSYTDFAIRCAGVSAPDGGM